MKNTLLGRARPLAVRSVGLGCMGMVSAYPPIPDKKDMIRFTREAVDQGATFLDTAEVYGPYTSEEILGQALEGIRDQVVIATKFGFAIQNGQSVGLDSRPSSIRKAVEGSLKRLRTDHIDLLYQHRADPNVPVETVAETVAQLMQEGKVLHWGLSEVSLQTIQRAHAVLPLTAVQNEYSLWYREAQRDLIPTLEELGIGLVCFSPLGRGYLTGTLSQDTQFSASDVRASMPRFRSPEALGANQAIVALVRQYAAEKGCTPCPVRPGLAHGAKALDRPHSGHHQTPPAPGEPGCGPGLLLPGRALCSAGRFGPDPHPRGAVQRPAGAAGGAVIPPNSFPAHPKGGNLS